MAVKKEFYGTMPDGKQVDCYTLTNANDVGQLSDLRRHLDHHAGKG